VQNYDAQQHRAGLIICPVALGSRPIKNFSNYDPFGPHRSEDRKRQQNSGKYNKTINIKENCNIK